MTRSAGALFMLSVLAITQLACSALDELSRASYEAEHGSPVKVELSHQLDLEDGVRVGEFRSGNKDTTPKELGLLRSAFVIAIEERAEFASVDTTGDSRATYELVGELKCFPAGAAGWIGAKNDRAWAIISLRRIGSSDNEILFELRKSAEAIGLQHAIYALAADFTHYLKRSQARASGSS